MDYSLNKNDSVGWKHPFDVPYLKLNHIIHIDKFYNNQIYNHSRIKVIQVSFQHYKNDYNLFIFTQSTLKRKQTRKWSQIAIISV